MSQTPTHAAVVARLLTVTAATWALPPSPATPQKPPAAKRLSSRHGQRRRPVAALLMGQPPADWPGLPAR